MNHEKQETVAHTQVKKQFLKTVPEEFPTLDLLAKSFK